MTHIVKSLDEGQQRMSKMKGKKKRGGVLYCVVQPACTRTAL